jgi:hypothetical protein
MTDLTPEARRTLMAARAAADPTAADKERGRVLLGAALATSAGLATATAAAQATGKVGVALSAKLAVGGLALGLAIATGIALTLPNAPETSSPSRAVASTTQTPVAPHESVAAPAPVPNLTTTPSIASGTARTSVARSVASGHAGRRPHVAHVAEEVALIGKAETALEAGQLREALRALDGHARQFADGQLQQERLGLRAIVLCTVSDSRGRTEATRFLRKHPWSAMTGRVRTACLPSLNGSASGEDTDEP